MLGIQHHPEKSREEIAARVELGLFTNQVKKQFLECPPKEQATLKFGE
jgi:hypothetical protein